MPRLTGIRCGVNWMVTWLASGEGEFLLDFGEVPVLWEAVGADALVAFDEEILPLDLAPGAADAAQGIRDDPGGLDQVGLKQRDERQQDARRVAARGRRRGQAFLISFRRSSGRP